MIVEAINPSQVMLGVIPVDATGTVKTNISSGTVRVIHYASGVETVDLSAQSLSADSGSNIWYYAWNPASLSAGHYMAEYTITDNDAISTTVLEDIVIGYLGADITTIKQMELNRWKIDNNQLTIYADDGTTPLKVFDLKDESGNPTEDSPKERDPV